jgi:hypothetical protein
MSPDLKPRRRLLPAQAGDDESTHIHRQLIGLLGAVLPFGVWLMAGLRPTPPLPRWTLLGSVSSYYYTGAGVLFVGLLSALAVFLLTYKGYRNKYQTRDRVGAVIAGTAAACVAFFPTNAPLPELQPTWWTPASRFVHYIAAFVLFSTFAFFSLVQFPKSDPTDTQHARAKQVRNVIYRVCGVGIMVCVLWIVIAARSHTPIFWPEALALEFFAISWLVKGRAINAATAAARRALDFARHPGQLHPGQP